MSELQRLHTVSGSCPHLDGDDNVTVNVMYYSTSGTVYRKITSGFRCPRAKETTRCTLAVAVDCDSGVRLCPLYRKAPDSM